MGDALERHCDDLHGQVRDILKKEPMQIRVNVLLASLFGATEGAPHETWAPYLANFLALLAARDGVFIGVASVDTEMEDDEEGETLH